MRHISFILTGCMLFQIPIWPVLIDHIKQTIEIMHNPFTYDMHLQVLPGKSSNEEVMLCLHGMGSDYRIAEALRSNPELPFHLVSFNFPDYQQSYTSRNWFKAYYGTIEELLPALYIWKELVGSAQVRRIHLYGFSAGAAVLVNMIAVLKNQSYTDQLLSIGITNECRLKMIQSVQSGSIILEVPLKSFDEIADRTSSVPMRKWAQRAKKNGLSPIDNLCWISDIEWGVFICFAEFDTAVGERDNQKFYENCKKANFKYPTLCLLSQSRGHLDFHPELWKEYYFHVVMKLR